MEENYRNAAKSIMDTTSNRSVYKKARKIYLEQKRHIRCSICAPHRGENDDRKCYGTLRSWTGGKKVRFPSWKLATKNRKQWNEKPKTYKITRKGDYDCNFRYSYIEIEF